MKKLLLCGILGILSQQLIAEPILKVININQELEMENENGKQDFDDVWLWNKVNLTYGDWIFGLTAGKDWAIDLGDDGAHSKTGRVQLNASKKINKDLILGVAWRMEDTLDKYYGNWTYDDGVFWSYGEYWYEAQNSTNTSNPDSINIETIPLGFKYGAFKIAYYLGYYNMLGTIPTNGKESELEHHIRLFADLYKDEKWSISTEARFTFHHSFNYNEDSTPYRKYKDFGRTRLYLYTSYKASENLTLYGRYGYEWRNWSYENGDKRENYGDFSTSKGHAAENYQNFAIGWIYTF